MSDEHLIGLSTSFWVSAAAVTEGRQPTWPRSLLRNNVSRGPIAGTRCCTTMTLDRISARITQRHCCTTMSLLEYNVAQQWHWTTLVQQWTRLSGNNSLKTVMQQWEPRSLLEHIVAQRWSLMTLLQQWRAWCGVKNTCAMLVYSKEYPRVL
jgi:hypothetical protein